MFINENYYLVLIVINDVGNLIIVVGNMWYYSYLKMLLFGIIYK